MGLLSGLSNMGLGKLENADIYEEKDEKKEEEQKAKDEKAKQLADEYMEALENSAEQSKEPYKAWSPQMGCMENCVFKRICESLSCVRYIPSYKQ